MSSKDAVLVARPDIRHETVDASAFGVVEKPLSPFERVYNLASVRKGFILLVLALAWEIGARILGNDLLFPSFSATMSACSASGAAPP